MLFNFDILYLHLKLFLFSLFRQFMHINDTKMNLTDNIKLHKKSRVLRKKNRISDKYIQLND